MDCAKGNIPTAYANLLTVDCFLFSQRLQSERGSLWEMSHSDDDVSVGIGQPAPARAGVVPL